MNTEISNGTDEFTLKELLFKGKHGYRYLLSKWPVLLTSLVIGGLVGVCYGIFSKPSYTATTTFVLESGESAGGLGQYAGLASMVGIDMSGDGGGIFQGDNIIELYKSRNMIVKTLMSEVEFDQKKDLLVNQYIDFNALHDKWKGKVLLEHLRFSNKPKLDDRQTRRLKDSVLNTIVLEINKKYLDVAKLDKKLSIIKVDVKSENELFAKSFNEQLVKNVNDFYIQTKTKKSLQNINILQVKTDSVRRVLNGAINTAAAVTDATPNLNPTRQMQRTAPIQRSQVTAETNKAVLSELVKNLELSKLSLLKETPLIQVVDEPVLPLDRKKVGPVKGFVIAAFLAVFFAGLFLVLRKLLIMATA